MTVDVSSAFTRWNYGLELLEVREERFNALFLQSSFQASVADCFRGRVRGRLLKGNLGSGDSGKKGVDDFAFLAVLSGKFLGIKNKSFLAASVSVELRYSFGLVTGFAKAVTWILPLSAFAFGPLLPSRHWEHLEKIPPGFRLSSTTRKRRMALRRGARIF